MTQVQAKIQLVGWWVAGNLCVASLGCSSETGATPPSNAGGSSPADTSETGGQTAIGGQTSTGGTPSAGGGTNSPMTGGTASLPPDDKLLRDLTPSEQTSLCLSNFTDDAILLRCDVRAALEAREGSEELYASSCLELRATCISSRDAGSIDADCARTFDFAESCEATVTTYQACLHSAPEAEQRPPGCDWSYDEARAYEVPSVPTPVSTPACIELAPCYRL